MRLLCVVLTIVTSAIASGADWPMYRADAARSGYTSEVLPEKLAKAWTWQGQRPCPAWPTRNRQRYDVAYQLVAADGRLFFGNSADTKIYCLDAKTGQTIWTFFTDAPVRFAPLASGDNLYTCSDDGNLYCLDARQGDLRWRVSGSPRRDMLLGNDRMVSRWPARGGPVLADGVLYFAAGIWPSEGIFLYAVDPDTGEVLWCNDSSGSLDMDQPHRTARAVSGVAVQGYLACAGADLLVPTGRAVPAVFDRGSGRLRYFELQANTHAGGFDTIACDDFFCGGAMLFARSDGASIGRIGTLAAVHPEFLIAAQPKKVSGYARRKLATEKDAVDRLGKRTQQKRLASPAWTFDLPDDFGLALPIPKGAEMPPGERMSSTGWNGPDVTGEPGCLIVAGDLLLAGGRNRVLAVDVRSREIVWSLPCKGNVYGLAVSNGQLYATTDEGSLHCFSAIGNAQPKVVGPTPRVPEPQANDPFTAAADEILRRTGLRDGYCLDFGCGDGRLALELARRTNLSIYGVDEDPEKVTAARRLLDQTGWYGTRVTFHHAKLTDVPYPNGFADLVVSGRAVVGEEMPAGWSRIQRPFGGVACLGRPGVMSLDVRGPVPGVGAWTHQNTDPANSLCSPDAVLRGPLEMLWYRDTDLVMMSRHGRAPAPLVDQGRMYAEGLHALRAVSIYNGRTLWEYPLENVLLTYHREHSIGAAWVGSNYCLGNDSVYVHTGGRCLRLDATTGRKGAEFAPPPRPDGKPGTWTYIACDGPNLYGALANEDYLVRCWSSKWDTGGQFIESVLLFALDATSGQLKWTWRPEHSLRNNAIAVAGDRVYVIDRPLAKVDDLRFPIAEPLAQAKREAAAKAPEGESPVSKYVVERQALARLVPHPTGKLLALDAKAGKVLWSNDENVFGTQLAVSQRHGLLLMSYQPVHQAWLDSELGDRMTAFRLTDGKRVWDIAAKYVARPIVNDRTIYAEPRAWDLLTGEQLPFVLKRSYGCGIPCGSRHLLVFRSATLGYVDLGSDQGTVNYGGIRPGCWVNAIPAGGLLLMADSASWCNCSYLNQATVALQPKQRAMADK